MSAETVKFARARGHECRKSGTIGDEKIAATSGQNEDPAPGPRFAAAEISQCMASPEGYGQPHARVTKAFQPVAGRGADLS